MSKINWDAKLTEWGVDRVLKQGANWKLVSARVLDDTEMGQASVIQIVTLDDAGERKAGVVCNSDWDGRDHKDASPTPILTEGYPGPKFGACQFPMTGVIKLDNGGNVKEGGNHRCWVGDRATSDEVAHMGLVNDKSTSFEITFQLLPKPAPKPPVKR